MTDPLYQIGAVQMVFYYEDKRSLNTILSKSLHPMSFAGSTNFSSPKSTETSKTKYLIWGLSDQMEPLDLSKCIFAVTDDAILRLLCYATVTAIFWKDNFFDFEEIINS